jgi:hypothetical protein
MAGKTLEMLDGLVWGEPEFDSYLVSTCHRLRKKPVDEFTTEDFRIMINQGISLAHLVPQAIDLLEREPLAQGDYYPGDLLASVVRAESFLSASPDDLGRLVSVVERALQQVSDADEELRRELSDFLEAHGRLTKPSSGPAPRGR